MIATKRPVRSRRRLENATKKSEEDDGHEDADA
jgi:hypothetical protein